MFVAKKCLVVVCMNAFLRLIIRTTGIYCIAEITTYFGPISCFDQIDAGKGTKSVTVIESRVGRTSQAGAAGCWEYRHTALHRTELYYCTTDTLSQQNVPFIDISTTATTSVQVTARCSPI